MLACAAFSVAVVTTGPSVHVNEALAQTDQSSKDRAQQAYETALTLYKNGQYRGAIEKLVEARKLDPTAKELPYNLGLLYEKVGELGEAIKAFNLYLTLEPDDGEKDRVKAIIKRLEGALEDQRRAAAEAVPTASASASASAPPPPPSEEPPRKRGKLDGWVWGTGGLAVAGVIAGTVFGVKAITGQAKNDKTGPGTSASDLQARQSDAHTSAVVADISFAVAAAAGGAALALYLLRTRPAEEPPPTAFVAPQRGGAVVGASISF